MLFSHSQIIVAFFYCFGILVGNSIPTPISTENVRALHTSLVNADLDNHNATNSSIAYGGEMSKYAKLLGLEKFSNLALNSSVMGMNSEGTSADHTTQEDWGGNCTLGYWDKCSVIDSWLGYYLNPAEGPGQPKWLNHQLDCKLEPSICMKNGWTVNRCHILCMGQCNKEMLYKFDKYVSHMDECKAQAHG